MAKTVQAIIQQQVNLHFRLNDERIARQSTTVLAVSDGSGSTVTVRGGTNLSPEPWAIYEGQYGRWQALITPSLRVKPAHPIS